MKSSLKLPQPGHELERGTHSATHSARFPTMSKARSVETQLARDPVGTVLAPTPVSVLQVDP